MLNSALAYLIDVVFGLFTYALLLRFVMQVARAPLRKLLPGFRGIDWASLVATYLFQVLWLLAYYLLLAAVIALIKSAIWLLIVVVIVQAVLSWAAPDGPLAGLLNALTFPFLRPVRKFVPLIGGTLDLSPLIVIVVAQLVLMTLVPWLESGATRLFI